MAREVVAAAEETAAKPAASQEAMGAWVVYEAVLLAVASRAAAGKMEEARMGKVEEVATA